MQDARLMVQSVQVSLQYASTVGGCGMSQFMLTFSGIILKQFPRKLPIMLSTPLILYPGKQQDYYVHKHALNKLKAKFSV